MGDMYFRLSEQGHEVKIFVESPESQDIYQGMLERVEDWAEALPWIREAGNEGIILFEGTGFGEIQDELRRDGYQVIGGSPFGDKLESDRSYGQQMFAKMGLKIVASHRFTDYALAIEFIHSHPARYVFKLNGGTAPRTLNYVGVMEDGTDILALLALHRKQLQSPPDFVLMEHIQGVEVGVGAYFNGEKFLTPACLDWEHKRFFSGSQGELTGEMGTVVTYRGAEIIFNKTLAHIESELSQSGYCGYINVNLIANEEGLWPLEFTSRFGYPGFAICEALHKESWVSIFRKMLDRTNTEISTRDDFATGVVLTVPPFPYTHGYSILSKGLPILFRDTMTEKDHDSLHLAEVALANGQLVTSGIMGYVGVATGVGSNVQASRDRAYELAAKVVIPNLRYRNDIGDRVINGDYARLKELGYIS